MCGAELSIFPATLRFIDIVATLQHDRGIIPWFLLCEPTVAPVQIKRWEDFVHVHEWSVHLNMTHPEANPQLRADLMEEYDPGAKQASGPLDIRKLKRKPEPTFRPSARRD
jgi:hypothetical protein